MAYYHSGSLVDHLLMFYLGILDLIVIAILLMMRTALLEVTKVSKQYLEIKLDQTGKNDYDYL